MISTKQVKRDKPIPEFKKSLVAEIADKIKNSRTVLVASTKNLPASQFQAIKKKLRGKAEIIVAKKSIVLRAISMIEKGAVQNLKKEIGADVALIFSGMDAFELSSLLVDNQTSSKAKIGDIAPKDIEVEPGPTELMPGPAISELGAVGLKVAVEGGKLAIKKGATIVKKGETIDDKVSNVLGKLKILPMKVGFIPKAAYDAEDDTVYTEIKIDKKATLESLQEAISKSLGFAVNILYPTKETISHLISKAGLEERALEKIFGEKQEKPSEQEEAPKEQSEETPKEEATEQTQDKNDKEES